jgi:hypothetical protein
MPKKGRVKVTCKEVTCRKEIEMEWQKPQIKTYSEEELMKELQVKALSGQEQSSFGSFDRRR